MTGHNCKVITSWVGGGGRGVRSQTVTYNNWPLAQLFPPHMLVVLGFYYAGKKEEKVL